jgi:hypothetical protein
VIDSFSGLNIPRKCPRIGIDQQTGVISKFRIKGDPFHYGGFTPGDEFIVCEYDQPGGQLSQITKGRTMGGVAFRELPCVAVIEDSYTSEGDPILRSRRIVNVGTFFARTLLVLLRRNDGSGMIETVNLEIPLFIDSRCRWKVVESSSADGKCQISQQRVDGLFNVRIGKKETQCIRWLRMHADTAEAFEEADEVYISVESGLTVLIRHYKGRGWPQIEELKKNLKLVIDGHLFYLWYVRRIIRDQ